MTLTRFCEKCHCHIADCSCEASHAPQPEGAKPKIRLDGDGVPHIPTCTKPNRGYGEQCDCYKQPVQPAGEREFDPEAWAIAHSYFEESYDAQRLAVDLMAYAASERARADAAERERNSIFEMSQITYKNFTQTIESIRSELRELTKELCSLTPGGSEFVDDPKRCIALVRDRMATVVEKVKARQNAERELWDMREALDYINRYYMSNAHKRDSAESPNPDCPHCRAEAVLSRKDGQS